MPAAAKCSKRSRLLTECVGDTITMQWTIKAPVVVFCIGALAGHTALVLMPSSALPLVTLLLSWNVVSALAGAPFANTHEWISFIGSTVVHGLFASVSYVGLSRLARRWWADGERPEWVVMCLAVVYVAVLLLWRVRDWP